MGTYDWAINSAGGSPRIVYYDMARTGRATESTFSSVIGLSGPPPPPTNAAPVVNAGANQNLSSGVTTATLTATATDSDNDAMTYLWSKVSGPGTQVINNSTTKVAGVTGLTNGAYVFRFTATDSKGAASSATTGVNVAAANNIPVVTAGNNRTTSVGQDTVHLDGEAVDVEDFDCCAIKLWSQISGPTTSFTATDWNPVVSGLTGGNTYVFRLMVTDSNGAIGEATVSMITPVTNQVPIVEPDPPVVLVRSGTTATITCIPSDPDGPIPTLIWTQLSGPNTASITSPTNDTTGLTGLTIGTYKFKVVVTDNLGATAQTEVEVQVNNPPTVDLSGNTPQLYQRER